MKHGVAVTWNGPHKDAKLDAAYTKCLIDCLAIKLAEINASLARQDLPQVNFSMVYRDETSLKHG